MINTQGRWMRRGNAIELLDIQGAASGQPESELEYLGSPVTSGPITAPSSQPTLRKGAKGSAVTAAQQRLLAHGYNPGPIDGIFGGGTEGAVKAFQSARGLYASGIVDSACWSKLNQNPPAPSTKPGATPGQPSGSAAVERIIAEAQKHIGFQEGANNTNPFSAHFGVHNVPWCAYFVSYCHTKAGISLNIGGCDAMLDYCMSRGRFFATPKRGDIVFFDFEPGDGPSEHVGIVETVSPTGIVTIEGNASNMVKRGNWTLSSSKILGYGRLA